MWSTPGMFPSVHTPSREIVQLAFESPSFSTISTFCEAGKEVFSATSAACALVIACAK
jgi:hypothetical protein